MTAEPKKPDPTAPQGPERLDVALRHRGLVESRERARRLIRDGQVTRDGVVLRRPSTPVAPDAELRVLADHPYVGRGGLKLEAALDQFEVEVRDCVVLDLGASTGGFTDCVLRRGARRVYAVDVGHDQLHRRLREDARVINLEGTHARDLEPLPELSDLVTVDVSFIPLRLVLAEVPGHVAPDARVVALLKPQFEGREGSRRGVVRRHEVRARVTESMRSWCTQHGWTWLADFECPVAGDHGNRERWLLLRPPATPAAPPG